MFLLEHLKNHAKKISYALFMKCTALRNFNKRAGITTSRLDIKVLREGLPRTEFSTDADRHGFRRALALLNQAKIKHLKRLGLSKLQALSSPSP